jgi:hypothetical protein
MSHQDKDDLRTPVAELKELLAPIRQVSLDGIRRHGNAWLDLTGVMITAILTFGWNQQQTLRTSIGAIHLLLTQRTSIGAIHLLLTQGRGFVTIP